MRLELNDSGVLFNREEHTYLLNGKYLSGITDMLHRQLFPDEFSGVPAEMIEQAALYGTSVHESIEAFDSTWTNDGTIEVADYIEICHKNSLTHERSEYCVTDGANWASKIDKVFRIGENEFNLADIKTYGTMNPQKMEKARWQLSIYAYLFELQNPNATVAKLYIIHLRNKMKGDGSTDHISTLIEVDRIPSEVCKSLLDTDLAGEQFDNPFTIPADIAEHEDEIRSLMLTKKEAEERLNELKAEILSRMEAMSARSWSTETMKITRKLPSTRSSFDLKRFQHDYPDYVYSSYMKTSTIAGSLVITI